MLIVDVLMVDSDDFDAILSGRDRPEISGEDARAGQAGIRPSDLPRPRTLLASAPPTRSKEK